MNLIFYIEVCINHLFSGLIGIMHIRKICIEKHREKIIPQHLVMNRYEIEVQKIDEWPNFPVCYHCRPEFNFDLLISLFKGFTINKINCMIE